MSHTLQTTTLTNLSGLTTHSFDGFTPACSCRQCIGSQDVTDPFQNTDSKNTAPAPQPLVGDYRIDALLSGMKWENTSIITYSFYSNQLKGAYYGAEDGVSEVSNGIKENVRYIIENFIKPYIALDLVEVQDTAQSYGQVRYMFSNDPGYAYAYLPSESYRKAGDIHLNPDHNNFSHNGFNSGPGSHGFLALIHETLHALGLKHPGDYNGAGTGDGPFLSGDEDNTTNTVMTYNFAGSSAATLMPYDILALQNLYGRGTLNSGKITYTFDTVHSFTDGSQAWGRANTTIAPVTHRSRFHGAKSTTNNSSINRSPVKGDAIARIDDHATCTAFTSGTSL